MPEDFELASSLNNANYDFYDSNSLYNMNLFEGDINMDVRDPFIITDNNIKVIITIIL